MSHSVTTQVDARGVCQVTLSRPEKHNAFDADLIKQLLNTFTALDQDDTVRLVVVTGEGKSFSSGADLDWMKSMAGYSRDQNVNDALALSDMMYALYAMSKPVVARVNGSAFGGALGLIACCDIAVAVESAKFSFSEVKIGLIPAVISPFVVNAIGKRQANRLFLTGEAIDANGAREIGLIHAIATSDQLDDLVETQVAHLLAAGPAAQRASKGLLQQLVILDDSVRQMTAERIADIRVSAEGQEGLKAFLEKRKPAWLP